MRSSCWQRSFLCIAARAGNSAVKWIADAMLIDFRPSLEKELERADLSPRMFLATTAALDRLDGKKPADIPSADKLLDVASDENAPAALSALALRLVSPDDKRLTVAKLENFLRAFAKRYDGQPWLRYIDIGSIGDWGEGHTSSGSKLHYDYDQRKPHVDLHLKYFKKTQIVVSDDNIRR